MQFVSSKALVEFSPIKGNSRLSIRKTGSSLLCVVSILSIFAVTSAQDSLPTDQVSVDQAREEEAYAVALEAYVYGYPRVEMARRRHNETNLVAPDQTIYAPANQFYFFGRLARPGDGRVLKAPNNDTLYASAFLDLANGPVVLRVPEMGNRVYVALIIDATGSVIQRLGSGVSGRGGVDYAFVAQGKEIPLPQEMHRILVAGNDMWILMRVATDGTPSDEKLADELLRKFRLAPISRIELLDELQTEPPDDRRATREPLQPFGKIDYFQVLASMLERNPMPVADRGLLARWERIGLSAGRFDGEGLSPPVRRGIERAIKQGEKIVAAAQFSVANVVNGWNYSLKVGRIGNDWAMAAAIARGGYGNLPEDSVYYQRALDSQNVQLTGQNRYSITFPQGELPPVEAF